MDILELKKLSKDSDDTALYDWMRFVASTEADELEMLAKKNPYIGESVGVLHEMSEDEAERMIAESRERALRDQRARLILAEQKGIEQGIARGEHNKALETARNFKALGVEFDIIVKATGLSFEEVEKL